LMNSKRNGNTSWISLIAQNQNFNIFSKMGFSSPTIYISVEMDFAYEIIEDYKHNPITQGWSIY
jgi:hypothetical protein